MHSEVEQHLCVESRQSSGTCSELAAPHWSPIYFKVIFEYFCDFKFTRPLLKLQDVLDLNCRKHIVVKLIVNKDLIANSKNIWPRCGLYCGHFYNNPM